MGDNDEMGPLVRAAGADPYDGPPDELGVDHDDVIELFHQARLSLAVYDNSEGPEVLSPDRFLTAVLKHYAELPATDADGSDDLRYFR